MIDWYGVESTEEVSGRYPGIENVASMLRFEVGYANPVPETTQSGLVGTPGGVSGQMRKHPPWPAVSVVSVTIEVPAAVSTVITIDPAGAGVTPSGTLVVPKTVTGPSGPSGRSPQ